MPDHLLLLDASGFIHRAYHAANPSYRESDGLPTWAVIGFLSMTWRLLGAAQADMPTLAAAVFDAPGKNFRHKLYAEYKNNRPARDKELTDQLPFVRHAAEALGVTPLEVTGYEADDVIATLAARAQKVGMRVTIVSSDKDFCQCVKDGEVEIVDPMSRKRILRADVRDGKKFGVEPHQVPDVQALAGDPVDNIPGIDGLGIRGAASLIRRFGTLEDVLKAAQGRKEYFAPRLRAELKKNGDKALLYRKLTTLKRNVPLKVELQSLTLKPVMREHVMAFLRVLEAPQKFEAIFALDPKVVRVVERIEKPLAWWAAELKRQGQKIPDEPQCGFFQRRLVRGGPWVPCRIFREPEADVVTGKPTGMDLLKCEVRGEARDPISQWEALARRPIDEATYLHQMALGAWAEKHAPHEPEANPAKAIDWLTAPL